MTYPKPTALPQAVRAAMIAPLTAAFFTALPPARARQAAFAFVDAVMDGCITDVFATARAFTVHRVEGECWAAAIASAAARASLVYVRALDVVVDGEPLAAIDRVVVERKHVERMARHGVPITQVQKLITHRTEVAA